MIIQDPMLFYSYGPVTKKYLLTTGLLLPSTKELTFIDDTYEIYSHIAGAYSRALGREHCGNSIDGNVDLDANFSFGGKSAGHSGQFNGINMSVRGYWKRMLAECGVAVQ